MTCFFALSYLVLIFLDHKGHHIVPNLELTHVNSGLSLPSKFAIHATAEVTFVRKFVPPGIRFLLAMAEDVFGDI